MIDFKKDPAYKSKTKPQTICIPEELYIKVDGEGAPSSQAFQEAVQIVYGLIYSIKFWDKNHKPPKGYDKFKVAPLEGIWRAKSGKEFDLKKPEDWQWTVLMRVPEFVTKSFFDKVMNDVVSKKKSDIYKKARLETTHEGLCAQLLHIGPYDQEKGSLDKLIDFVEDNGYEIYGRHHEIYMNDPSKVAPEKFKTILRYPIRKKVPEFVLLKD